MHRDLLVTGFLVIKILVALFPFCTQTVALWDLRNLKLKLHSFESHKDEIFQVRETDADNFF